MEIFEMRYFLAVASRENIHRASERLRVSPGSLSKAISRLEGELGVKLFSREGRHIRLTESGKILERRASEIIQCEEASRLEIAGHRGSIHVVMTGAEILLSEAGLVLTDKIKKRHPGATVEYHAKDDAAAIEEVVRGDAHLGIITTDSPPDLRARTVGESTFVTSVGRAHPLYAAARAKRTIPVDEVLRYAFVSPSHPLLGQVGRRQSFDGWREDKFPRKVEYLASSLKILEEIVSRGRAIAYLPDYLAAKLDVLPLKISGCPYHCSQTIRVITRATRNLGWLNQLW
jgi:DNA-binding transcriptional LysR family regulator